MNRLIKLWQRPKMVILLLLFAFLAAYNGTAEGKAAEELEPSVIVAGARQR